MDRSNLDNIERAVSQLSQEDLAKFRTWFAEFDAANWDRQFEADVAAGRLDALAEKALTGLRQKTTRKQPQTLVGQGIYNKH